MPDATQKISPEEKARRERQNLRELATRLNGQGQSFNQAVIEHLIDLKSRVEELETRLKIAA